MKINLTMLRLAMNSVPSPTEEGELRSICIDDFSHKLNHDYGIISSNPDEVVEVTFQKVNLIAVGYYINSHLHSLQWELEV